MAARRSDARRRSCRRPAARVGLAARLEVVVVVALVEHVARQLGVDRGRVDPCFESHRGTEVQSRRRPGSKTIAFVPLNCNALAVLAGRRPGRVRRSYPVCPLPDASVTAVPDPSSNPYAATNPDDAGEAACATRRSGATSREQAISLVSRVNEASSSWRSPFSSRPVPPGLCAFVPVDGPRRWFPYPPARRTRYEAAMVPHYPHDRGGSQVGATVSSGGFSPISPANCGFPPRACRDEPPGDPAPRYCAAWDLKRFFSRWTQERPATKEPSNAPTRRPR